MTPGTPASRIATERELPLPGLLLVVLVGLAVRLAPLAQFAWWGSDTGEYLHLTQRLATTGRITFAYDGWGLAYPYFPGYETLAAALHATTGLPLTWSLKLTGPLLGALTAGAVALLAHHVTGHGHAALVAGLFSATAMPLVFVTSHPMPATAGHLLVAAFLLVTLHGATRVHDQGRLRAAAPHLALLAPLGLALLVTHHLSVYFLVGALAGGALLRELGSHPSPAWRWEALLVTPLVLGASAWWLGVATPFRERIVGDVLPLPPVVVALLALALLALLPLLVHAKRRLDPAHRLQHRAHLPNAVTLGGTVLGVLAGLLALSLLVTVTSIPGTRIDVTPRSLLHVTPLLLGVAVALPGLQLLKTHRHGAFVQGWTLALAGSLLLATVTRSHVLLPYRHADALILPLSIGLGAGAVHLARHPPGGLRRKLAVTALTLFVVANAAGAYPPPRVLGGFQEGITHAEMDAVHWARTELPADAAVATDHRLSSMLFGVAHVNASWDTGGRVLHAPTPDAARQAMDPLEMPSGKHRVTHVLVSPTMVEHGVALYQWENAKPLAGPALEKFDSPLFTPVYEEDGVTVYRVEWDGTN